MAMRAGQIEDPRSPLYRFRRRQLEAILRDNHIPYPQDIPAETARMLIRQSDIDARKYLDDNGQFMPPQEAQASRPDKSEEPERKVAGIASGVDLEAMKMPDIRRLCSQMDVSWTKTDKKAELIARLRERMDGQPA